MTTVGYFNSLRELGGMRRMIDDEVANRLRRTERRKLANRYLNEQDVVELTSRVTSSDIPDVLDRLGLAFTGTKPAKGERWPLAIALATNMISVGVDVPRLGLMICSGQPKTTSEYIQATSRVGRDAGGPGLVITLYNWARPRDLSHYETFEHYHQTYYRQVEALSVTPFARRSLDRGATALLVSEARHTRADWNPKPAAQVVPANQHEFDPIADALHQRAELIAGPAAAGQVDQLVSSRRDKWSTQQKAPGVTLAYARGRGDAVNLIQSPEAGTWTDFTVPNSLREVEVAANLQLREDDPSDDPVMRRRRRRTPTPRRSPTRTPAWPSPRTWAGDHHRRLRRAQAGRHAPPQPGDPLLRCRFARRPPEPQRHRGWPRPLGHDSPGGRHRGPPARRGAGPARPPGRAVAHPARRATDHEQPLRRVGPHRRPGDRLPPMAALHGVQPPLPGGLRCPHPRAQPAPHRQDPLHPPELRQGSAAAGGGARPVRHRVSRRAPRRVPWVRFAHQKKPVCANPVLRVNDVGSGGRATDLLVTCLTCGDQATLAKAFGPAAKAMMPQCRGRHPNLGRSGEPCPEQLRTLVLGASNLWFSVSVSVLSLPVGGGSLAQLVYGHWAELDTMAVKEVLVYALQSNRVLQGAFAGHDVDEIWEGVEARRAGGSAPAGTDVLGPEWSALTAATPTSPSPHFEAEPTEPPALHSSKIAGVTLAHRLRVVTALCGFTRISAAEPGDVAGVAPLESAGAPGWVPVVENRGEGIFVRLDETEVQTWEGAAYDHPVLVAMRRAHREWRQARGLDPGQGWPGERYVLLHSLSHALINELAIQCGDSSASISERIYSRRPGEGPEPMAGILLYTSAPDAEGTLGGLVSLGRAGELGPVLGRALERAGLCSSDPLCADHEPDAATSAIHGAACHACLLVAETSCERGNRYLDRGALVETFRQAGPDPVGKAFFA